MNETRQPGSEPDRLFLRSLTLAVAALTLSTSALLLLYTLLSPDFRAHNAPLHERGMERRKIEGSDLAIRLGMAEKSSRGRQEITQLGGDQRALLTRIISLSAVDFPFLGYRISGMHQGIKAFLIWRTSDRPEQLSHVRLSWGDDRRMTIHLADHPDWRGRITELGLDIYGDLRGQPLTVHCLELMPPSGSSLVATVFSEWTAFNGWTHSSINHLPAKIVGHPPSPVVAVAAIAILSLLILKILQVATRSNMTLAYGSVVFLCWLSIDLLWQQNLSRQLAETNALFSGKSPQEKHLADLDGPLYEYLSRLKRDVLPDEPTRIILLHDSDASDGHVFERLRAQYHLLPHNVYNQGRWPPRAHIREGDLILTLGSIPGLNYDLESRELRWGIYETQAELIDQDSAGKLYRAIKSND